MPAVRIDLDQGTTTVNALPLSGCLSARAAQAPTTAESGIRSAFERATVTQKKATRAAVLPVARIAFSEPSFAYRSDWRLESVTTMPAVTVMATMDLVADGTTHRRSSKRMVSGRVADHAADGGALQASASVRRRGHHAKR